MSAAFKCDRCNRLLEGSHAARVAVTIGGPTVVSAQPAMEICKDCLAVLREARRLPTIPSEFEHSEAQRLGLNREKYKALTTVLWRAIFCFDQDYWLARPGKSPLGPFTSAKAAEEADSDAPIPMCGAAHPTMPVTCQLKRHVPGTLHYSEVRGHALGESLSWIDVAPSRIFRGGTEYFVGRTGKPPLGPFVCLPDAEAAEKAARAADCKHEHVIQLLDGGPRCEDCFTFLPERALERCGRIHKASGLSCALPKHDPMQMHRALDETWFDTDTNPETNTVGRP